MCACVRVCVRVCVCVCLCACMCACVSTHVSECVSSKCLRLSFFHVISHCDIKYLGSYKAIHASYSYLLIDVLRWLYLSPGPSAFALSTITSGYVRRL